MLMSFLQVRPLMLRWHPWAVASLPRRGPLTPLTPPTPAVRPQAMGENKNILDICTT